MCSLHEFLCRAAACVAACLGGLGDWETGPCLLRPVLVPAALPWPVTRQTGMRATLPRLQLARSIGISIKAFFLKNIHVTVLENNV